MIKSFALTGLSIFVLILPRTEDPDLASLGGRVTDMNSSGIAGANISVRNTFSGDVEHTTTDATGLYGLTDLKQGRYSMFVEAKGYGSKWVFNVFLFNGEHTRLDVTLAASGKEIRSADCMYG